MGVFLSACIATISNEKRYKPQENYRHGHRPRLLLSVNNLLHDAASACRTLTGARACPLVAERAYYALEQRLLHVGRRSDIKASLSVAVQGYGRKRESGKVDLSPFTYKLNAIVAFACAKAPRSAANCARREQERRADRVFCIIR